MMAALTIGAALNVLILIVLGGITVYKFVAPKEVELKAPPALKPLEPAVVKYNQKKTKDRQQNSPRPPQRQIKARSVSSIMTPNIDIQVSDVSPNVNVASTNVSSIGSGMGLSSGGLRMGVSAVNFFGIESRGERIVIIMDVAGSMLHENRGDIPGFQRVKEQVIDVIDGLNSATLFNLVIFANGVDVMSSNLVLANRENKQRAAQFIDPYWKARGGRITTDARRSPYLKNYTPNLGSEFQALGGGSRMDAALAATFEMNADAIFMITDGTPHVKRALTTREQSQYEKSLAAWEKRKENTSPKEIKEWQDNRKQVAAKNKKIRENDKKKRDAQGLDARIGKVKGLASARPPWGNKPSSTKTIGPGRDFINWMRDLAETNYGNRSKWPPVNIIGYSIPEDSQIASFLNDLRRAFPGGKYKTFGDYRTDDNA